MKKKLRQPMQYSLRNLRIRDQMLLLTLPVLLVLLAVTGLFIFCYRLASPFNLSPERGHLVALRTDSLLLDTNAMYGNAEGFFCTRKAEFLRNYKAASDSVNHDFASLRDLESDSPPMTAQLDAIQKEVRDWQSQYADPAIEHANRGFGSGPTAEVVKRTERFSDIQKELAHFLQANEKFDAAVRNENQRAIRRALWRGILMTVLVVVLLLLLVPTVSRRITQPVQQLIRASDRLRQGDFDPALPRETQNEFGELSRSFLHMAQALRQDREELAAIKRFSEAVTECTSESEVYDQILHALRDRFHPNQVIIFKLRAEEDILEAVASLKPLPSDLQQWPVIEGKHSCKAVRMGRPFRVNDVSVEPLCPGKFALPDGGSYYCGPLIAGGIMIGSVRLEGETGFWTPEREGLVESYLSTTASVLSNLHLLQTMREQANIDPLTGLYNRRFCKDYARKLMAMARRKDTPLGFIMLDLDHFKRINDIYGHEEGDGMLILLARTITQSMRESNLIARLGGEEFVVLLPDTSAQSSLVVAERIRKAVANISMPRVNEKPLPQVTISLGVAVYPTHGGSFDEVLQAADRALYESKRKGRNRATLYMELTGTTG